MPPIAGIPYTTPARVWQLALPPATLFLGESNLVPGEVAVPTPTAVAGTGELDADGNPHDTYSNIRIRCTVSGSINQTGLQNPGPLPQFQWSYGGGPWSRPKLVSVDSDTAFINDIEHGIRWRFSGASPAFLVNDLWSTSATPSPDIVAFIASVSSVCNQFLIGSYKLPLDTWPESLERVVAWLVRWELVCKRGLDKDQSMLAYAPDKPVAALGGYSPLGWLQAAQRGDFQDDADFSGAGKAFEYPSIMAPMLDNPAFGTRMWKP